MIRVKIEQIIVEEYRATENFIVERVPTEITECGSAYESRPKVCYHEKSEPREVTKRRETTIELLRQEIADDTAFHLNRVIKAINGIGV